MSAEAPPPDQAAEPKQSALSALTHSLDTSDRIALAAVATASIALIVGIVQTLFMWTSRNDEIEAALRAEQVRACVTYRLTAVDANERAQFIAADGERPADMREFERLMSAYRTAIGQLGYLLPQDDSDGLQEVEIAAVTAYNAFLDEDYAALAEISRADGAWSRGHDRVLEACESVIRDVRDR